MFYLYQELLFGLKQRKHVVQVFSETPVLFFLEKSHIELLTVVFEGEKSFCYEALKKVKLCPNLIQKENEVYLKGSLPQDGGYLFFRKFILNFLECSQFYSELLEDHFVYRALYRAHHTVSAV